MVVNRKIEKQCQVFVLLVALVFAFSACSDSDSLNPAGNANTIQGDNYTMYVYPDNDSVESCIVYDNGRYECTYRE